MAIDGGPRMLKITRLLLSCLAGKIPEVISFGGHLRAAIKPEIAMSPAMESLTLLNGVSYRQPVGLFIDNAFKATEEQLDVVNPSTEETICQIHVASEEDVDQAVQSCKKSFDKVWSRKTIDDRAKLLFKLADLVERDSHILASIETANGGKPYKQQSLPEVNTVAAIFRYYAGWCDKSYGDTISIGDKFTYTTKEPIGVCAAIVPWNFPLLIAAGWKLAPCLATGNCMVLKLSELTPLSMLYFCKLVVEAGFPPGVVSVVNGPGATVGEYLTTHPDVRKITFTGSTAVGQQIMARASSNLKRVTVECGGKSAMLVIKDADVESAVQSAFYGSMGNMGQVCSAITRAYVQSEVYKSFVEGMTKLVKSMKAGDPFDDTTFQGPQISAAHKAKILRYIQVGKKEATIGYEGEVPEGLFVPPVLFTEVLESTTIVKDEIFGPVLCICQFDDVREAIESINDSDYGLLASVFTENLTQALTISKRLHVGQVFINSANDLDFRVPFGGCKMSGYGKELGKEALEEFTQVKAVHVNLAPKPE